MVATMTFSVQGMTYASCEVVVRTTLKKLDSECSTCVSVKDKQAVADYEPAKVTPEKMVKAIKKLGDTARLAKGA